MTSIAPDAIATPSLPTTLFTATVDMNSTVPPVAADQILKCVTV